jgi:hypothetical protein
VRVATKLDAAGVAVSSVDPQQAGLALDGLRELDAALAPGVPVWLGGANARYLAEELASARVHAVEQVQAMTSRVLQRAVGG